MATVHFEKGNYNFSGIYPFLNNLWWKSSFAMWNL